MTSTLLPGTLGERYRIDRELGRGGMAAVYLADDLKHGRRVAIKIMHPELAAAIGQDRFLREIEIAARLTHPHILPLFDSGAVDGRVFYVMPYIEGESLRARLGREKQLGLEDALRLAREIAGALGHAHQHGLVHRDVKPENVLLADGIALVADFGIARAMRTPGAAAEDAPTLPPATTMGAVLGTPRYMAPEQAGGGEVDARADVYALGCVLYEMLAGVAPFEAPTHEALLRMHAQAAPRPVTELRPNVPAAVAAAIARALEKLPADRFPGMASFAEALTAAGAATPTPTAEMRDTATPHNLPRQRSRFVGREKELAECVRILAETHLLTLTGVGGSGKTRLAMRLAETMLEGFPDGVWFADLASVEADVLVPEIVANVVRAKADSGQSQEDAIVASLADQRVMLVFDNCEHLLAPVSDLVDRLLGRLSELVIVVTSREGLAIEGERLYAVRSLSLPAAGEDADPERLLRYEAVRLFVTRAQETDRDFEIDRGNAGTVADICRRLDGIPLALELAAARTRALSVDQIARMLDDRFRLLTGGMRGVLERHRTLRAAVQWSYDHLGPEEQELFVTLSVFAGGWRLEAAAAVAGADEFEVLERLTRLIDKSLVVIDRSGGDTRYRMLETLRQFGLELLAASGRADTVRRAHLDHFLEWVLGMRDELRYQFALAALARLESDLDNLRAALTWGFEHAPDRAVLLNRRLVTLWHRPGFYAEGRRWYAQTLALEAGLDPRDRAEALHRSGRLAFMQGDFEASERFYDREEALQRERGDRVREGAAARFRSAALAYLGRLEEGRVCLERARAICEEIGDVMGLVRVDSNMGLNRFLANDLTEARRLFEACLAAHRKSGERDRMQVMIGNLALVDVKEGDPAAARPRLRECMAINREVRNYYGIGQDLPALAATFRLEGDAVSAARVLGACDALLAQIDAGLEGLEREVYATTTDALRGEMGAEAFEAARGEGRTLTWDDVIAMA